MIGEVVQELEKWKGIVNQLLEIERCKFVDLEVVYKEMLEYVE